MMRAVFDLALRREGCRIPRRLASEMGIESMYDE